METNIYQKLYELKNKDITLKRDTEWYWYNYATLGQIQEKLSEFLKELNLIVVHQVKDWYVVTQIRDLESDSFIESSIKMLEDTKAQDKWSEITYFRRYNLLCLLDLETEDDDWKKASKTPTKSNTASEDNDLPWIAQKNIDNLKNILSTGETMNYKDVTKN